jgi:hypothetical protein
MFEPIIQCFQCIHDYKSSAHHDWCRVSVQQRQCQIVSCKAFYIQVECLHDIYFYYASTKGRICLACVWIGFPQCLIIAVT